MFGAVQFHRIANDVGIIECIGSAGSAIMGKVEFLNVQSVWD